MLRIVLNCWLLLILSAPIRSDGPEITIGQGALKGKYQRSLKGRTFSSFTGIPYAKPPVGDLRFEHPVPADPWQGVLDASQPHALCPQMNVYINKFDITGNEDCLYLNVYTPRIENFTSDALLPVMFYIHGGGWMTGGANFGPRKLLEQDVVLVVINYRLGPLGFLSTGDEIVPGNNALKDQNLALRWVKTNIRHFGGNPNKITMFGQSAGGASTHFHMLSPLSRDLISAAIAHSGTAFATWSLSTKEESVGKAKKLAKLLDCPFDSNQKMIECLKKIDAYDIVRQDTEFLEYSYDPMIPFKPVIEPDVDGAFMTEDPLDTIKSGKVANIPFMTGLTSEDGAIKTPHLYNDSKLIKQLDEEFDKLAPYLFLYQDTEATKDVARKIKEYYLGNKKIDESTKNELTQMFTDGWFLLPEDITVRLHTKYTKQPVYYFLFGYRGAFSYSTLFGDPTYDYGVCHCDELLYLFSDFPFKTQQSQNDLKMNDVMTTLWTNFAKTGNPTPNLNELVPIKWKPVKTDKPEFYYIKNTSDIYMDKDLYGERARFWRSLRIDFQSQTIKNEL